MVKARLPYGLHTIQVAFTKDELRLHSIKLEGESLLEIGNIDDEETNDKEKKGRLETFRLTPEETLLGVEMF